MRRADQRARRGDSSADPDRCDGVATRLPAHVLVHRARSRCRAPQDRRDRRQSCAMRATDAPVHTGLDGIATCLRSEARAIARTPSDARCVAWSPASTQRLSRSSALSDRDRSSCTRGCSIVASARGAAHGLRSLSSRGCRARALSLSLSATNTLRTVQLMAEGDARLVARLPRAVMACLSCCFRCAALPCASASLSRVPRL